MTVRAILEHLLYVLVGRIHQVDIVVEYENRDETRCAAIMVGHDWTNWRAWAFGAGVTEEAALNAAIISILDKNGRWFTHRDISEIFLKLCGEDFDMLMDQPFCMEFVRKFTCSDPKKWSYSNWPV